MNTEDMLKELASLLNSFLIHPKFLEELRTLLKTDLKGKESIFFKILTTQLSNIKNFGSKIYTIDSNEILQGADGHYYSIHLQKSLRKESKVVQTKKQYGDFSLTALSFASISIFSG